MRTAADLRGFPALARTCADDAYLGVSRPAGRQGLGDRLDEEGGGERAGPGEGGDHVEGGAGRTEGMVITPLTGSPAAERLPPGWNWAAPCSVGIESVRRSPAGSGE